MLLLFSGMLVLIFWYVDDIFCIRCICLYGGKWQENTICKYLICSFDHGPDLVCYVRPAPCAEVTRLIRNSCEKDPDAKPCMDMANRNQLMDTASD